MTIAIMLSGSIAKQPETRTSKNGNSFIVATVRAQTAEGDLFASVTAFGDLAGTLVGLAKGDPVTVVGNGRVTTYQGKDGDTKAGLSITASRIIALVDQQVPPKAQRPKDGNGTRRRTEYHAPDSREYAPDFDDAVTF